MNKRWIDSLTDPVDPALFLEMMGVWDEACRTPLRQPGWTPPSGGGYYLSDIPLNRGGLAVTGAMRQRGLMAESGPCLTRLMQIGQLIEERDSLGDFVKQGDNDATVLIADAVLKAAAVADFKTTEGGGLALDIASVLHHARRFDAEDSKAEQAHA